MNSRSSLWLLQYLLLNNDTENTTFYKFNFLQKTCMCVYKNKDPRVDLMTNGLNQWSQHPTSAMPAKIKVLWLVNIGIFWWMLFHHGRGSTSHYIMMRATLHSVPEAKDKNGLWLGCLRRKFPLMKPSIYQAIMLKAQDNLAGAQLQITTKDKKVTCPGKILLALSIGKNGNRKACK